MLHFDHNAYSHGVQPVRCHCALPPTVIRRSQFESITTFRYPNYSPGYSLINPFTFNKSTIRPPTPHCAPPTIITCSRPSPPPSTPVATMRTPLRRAINGRSSFPISSPSSIAIRSTPPARRSTRAQRQRSGRPRASAPTRRPMCSARTRSDCATMRCV